MKTTSIIEMKKALHRVLKGRTKDLNSQNPQDGNQPALNPKNSKITYSDPSKQKERAPQEGLKSQNKNQGGSKS